MRTTGRPKSKPRQKKRNRVVVMLTDEDIKDVDAAAGKAGLDRSVWIRVAIVPVARQAVGKASP
jgi:hypothetical protein